MSPSHESLPKVLPYPIRNGVYYGDSYHLYHMNDLTKWFHWTLIHELRINVFTFHDMHDISCSATVVVLSGFCFMSQNINERNLSHHFSTVWAKYSWIFDDEYCRPTLFGDTSYWKRSLNNNTERTKFHGLWNTCLSLSSLRFYYL